MQGFSGDLKEIAKHNDFFRKVLFTGEHAQLVVMALASGEDIGEEVHTVDQLFSFLEGAGEAVLDGQCSTLEPGTVLCVPAGTRHNIVNTGSAPMKLFTIYAPPQHAPGTTHRTKAEAAAAEAREHTG